jgi:hypothetical protein
VGKRVTLAKRSGNAATSDIEDRNGSSRKSNHKHLAMITVSFIAHVPMTSEYPPKIFLDTDI